MPTSPIVQIQPLGFPWKTIDPFLFCVYHDDSYPRGNAHLGPDDLSNRQLGNDFSRKDGWSMYHGAVVPGFPAHPHRGFETISIARKGVVDHSDSLGASARYGLGDVQWLTTGSGIVHSEMMPLLNSSGPNPVELFQIWVNLPASSKMATPKFTMLWAENIPRAEFTDEAGLTTNLSCIAGSFNAMGGDTRMAAPVAPPPDSWAARRESDFSIWTLKMQAGAAWTLPPTANTRTRRQLFFFKGGLVRISGEEIAAKSSIELEADATVLLVNGAEESEFLLLQGVPIDEPVVQSGPFVMNTQSEITETIRAYQRTKFGGWPWPSVSPVHSPETPRFVQFPDGQTEHPPRTTIAPHKFKGEPSLKQLWDRALV